MKRSKRLNPVVQMVQKATEQALAKLGEANMVWSRDKQQLDDLLSYKGEYLARFRQADPLVMSSRKVLELRGFLEQLDQAIKAQEAQVANSLKGVEYQRQLWLQARSKEQAMQTLVERYQAEESEQQVRKEQLESDGHTTAMWHRKNQR